MFIRWTNAYERRNYMSITPAKFVPREMKTTIIKVYSYHNKNIQGIICNPFFKKDMPFENMMQLITMVETISDSLVFPQKAMQLRQFSDKNEKTKEICSERFFFLFCLFIGSL